MEQLESLKSSVRGGVLEGVDGAMDQFHLWIKEFIMR